MRVHALKPVDAPREYWEYNNITKDQFPARFILPNKARGKDVGAFYKAVHHTNSACSRGDDASPREHGTTCSCILFAEIILT